MDASAVTFPNNIVIALKEQLSLIAPPDEEDDDPGIPVVTRPLNRTDPDQCIGVSAGMWLPDEESYEMGGLGVQAGPTVGNYIIGIQAFVKHMDEEEGLAISATLAGAVRNTLVMSGTLRGALAGLVSTQFGYTERFSKSRVQAQRFMNNEIQGQFLFLSSLDFHVETQVNNL